MKRNPMMKRSVKNFGCFMLFSFAASTFATPSLAVETASIELTSDNVSANDLSKVVRGIADQVSPGIVTVYALRGPRMTLPMRLRQQTVHGHQSDVSVHRQTVSSRLDSSDDQGSGVIIDRRGIVLTCSHVVQHANAVFVRTADGRKFHASEVVCDPVSDLAIIRLKNATDLTEVKLADTDGLNVGDWVISLASPYDLQRSVSVGIVSSTQRWVASSPYPLIQNDACTNPGSSGGALLNLRGEVVGIIVGAFSTTGEFQGIGLATPINIIKDVAEQLRSNGYVERCYFGFQSQPLTAGMAKLLDSSIEAGLYVKEVTPGSPASGAGMREGDIIIGLDGTTVDKEFDTRTFGPRLEAGRSHRLSLIRDHETIKIELRQQNPEVPIPHQPIRETICDRCFEYFDASRGLGLSQLTPMLAEELKLPESARGVLITHVAFDSDAYREGVAAGMVIAKFNDEAVQNLRTYQDLSSKLDPDKPLLLLLQSDQEKHLVLLGRDESNSE